MLTCDGENGCLDAMPMGKIKEVVRGIFSELMGMWQREVCGKCISE